MTAKSIQEIGSQTDIKTKDLIYRYHRSGNPLKEALLIRELMDAQKHTQEDVGKLLQLSQGQISRRLRLLSLHPDLQFKLLHDKLRPSTAYALSKLGADKQKEYLLREHITLKEVEATHRSEVMTNELMQHLVTDTMPSQAESIEPELSEKKREIIRSRIFDIAEDVRHATGWSIKAVRAFLHSQIDITV